MIFKCSIDTSQFLIVLTTLASVVNAGLLPGDNGYQYDRPNSAGDFGRRNNGDVYSRYRPSATYGTPLNNGFGNYARQSGDFGYKGYQGYTGYQGYQGNYQGYQRDNLGYQDYQGNGVGSYRRYDDSDDGQVSNFHTKFLIFYCCCASSNKK